MAGQVPGRLLTRLRRAPDVEKGLCRREPTFPGDHVGSSLRSDPPRATSARRATFARSWAGTVVDRCRSGDPPVTAADPPRAGQAPSYRQVAGPARVPDPGQPPARRGAGFPL